VDAWHFILLPGNLNFENSHNISSIPYVDRMTEIKARSSLMNGLFYFMQGLSGVLNNRCSFSDWYDRNI